MLRGAMKELATKPVSAAPLLSLEQVIGQSAAVEVVRLAARQRRFLLLIGEPGTGKSMLGRAASELLPRRESGVVVTKANHQHPQCPSVLTLDTASFVQLAQKAARHGVDQYRADYALWLFGLVAALLCAVVLMVKDGAYGQAGILCLMALILWLKRGVLRQATQPPSYKVLFRFGDEQPRFVDATSLSAGALFGDVRHDPYQSGGAESPPHLLVEPGAVHLAHQGVLFIDEISNLDLASQRLLLTAIEDKALPITGRSLGSSGTLVRTEPVPCDFMLVAAGNLQDLEHLLPALRSRFRGYGYEVFLPEHRADHPRAHDDLGRFVAQEVAKEHGRIPAFSAAAIAALAVVSRRMAPEGGWTLRWRELGGILRIAGDLAQAEAAPQVDGVHVERALNLARPIEQQLPKANDSTATAKDAGHQRPALAANNQARLPCSTTR